MSRSDSGSSNNTVSAFSETTEEILGALNETCWACSSVSADRPTVCTCHPPKRHSGMHMSLENSLWEEESNGNETLIG